jgi:hypothetical protein
MAEEAPAPDSDPLARVSDRAQEYADIWRSAIERNAAGAYKPEDWFDDVNRTWTMAAEDAARAFAVVVDAVAARSTEASEPGDDDSANG